LNGWKPLCRKSGAKRSIRVDIALVHYPVINRNGETIGSAVTNLDLHDIARAGKTYGVSTYWVVTPITEQQQLARQIVDHWVNGHGGRVNSDRGTALSLISICSDLAEAVAGSTERFGEEPFVLATCARMQDNTITYQAIRKEVWRGRPILLVFGTAWGLDSTVLASADGVLPPLCGRTGFNHLSVRSAASIILDRLLGEMAC
jgi:hypothetical protein